MGALQLGDINLFVVTDVHSFIASHFHADGLCGAKRCDADFGTLSSFIARVRERADEEQKDVFVFDNGDVVDGTGLSTATKIDGGAVFPLLTALPLDALNCGNHELYQDTTVLDGLLGPVGGASSFAGFWNGTYLTSNIVLSTSEKPIGSRYALLTGKHGTRLLVMGWLYDMPDHCAAVNVTPVADGVRQPWFADAMRHASHVDAVVVLAHMHYVDPLVTVLLGAIRLRRRLRDVQLDTVALKSGAGEATRGGIAEGVLVVQRALVSARLHHAVRGGIDHLNRVNGTANRGRIRGDAPKHARRSPVRKSRPASTQERRRCNPKGRADTRASHGNRVPSGAVSNWAFALPSNDPEDPAADPKP